MVDSIKITALQDIGANIMYTTLVPVVDMSGTPTTKKANLQTVGNLILNGAGGSYFPRAAQANLALSVANAAQPNITSVGTLTTLTVSGNLNASNVVANFYFGDGGFLTNVAGGGSNYSNSNVANYLPTFAGTVGANAISSTSNVRIITDSGNANITYTFGAGGALTWPAPNNNIWAIEPNLDQEFEIKSTTNVVISTDTSNSNSHFTFDSNGIFTAPSNVNLLGTRLNIGAGSPSITLETPTIVIAEASNTFVQTALFNNDANGSADWVAYGEGGSDTEAWTDMGYAGHGFSDPTYTVTNPGDGYVFVQGYANGTGGSLVLATGENGNVPDIVFATNGFLSNAEFARIDHANNAFHLTRTGSKIKFQDGSIQNTAAIVWTTAPVSNTSAGTAGQAAYDSGGNLFVCVATNTWAKFAGTTSW